MSKNLFCIAVKPVEATDLSDKLKYILRTKFDLEDGPYVLKWEDKEYLNGLNDAGIEDADTLLEMMEKHDKIEIFLQ